MNMITHIFIKQKHFIFTCNQLCSIKLAVTIHSSRKLISTILLFQKTLLNNLRLAEVRKRLISLPICHLCHWLLPYAVKPQN